MFPAVPNMGSKRYKNMGLLKDPFWLYGGFSVVILFQREDMILFLRISLGSDR